MWKWLFSELKYFLLIVAVGLFMMTVIKLTVSGYPYIGIPLGIVFLFFFGGGGFDLIIKDRKLAIGVLSVSIIVNLVIIGIWYLKN